MNHPMRSITACLFALSMTAGAIADTITLKTAVRQRDGGGATITLGDIASLEGEEALRLASAPIVRIKSPTQPLEIPIADVRRALEAAGANWARINLSGRTVVVRPARTAAEAQAVPQAMNAAALEGSTAPAATAHEDESLMMSLDAIVSEQSVRGSIAQLIITQLRIDPRDMRLRFDADDAALLNTPLSTARFEVQPLGALTGDRMAFVVRAWNGTAIESKGQVTLIAQRQARMSRAARDLTRSALVREGDIETMATWLSPSEAMQVATPDAIVGCSLTRAIKAGETIRSRDIERAAMVKRGDLCTVRCLVGGVAISLQAEAKADGSLGEAIEFRKSGERESFIATITAANEAVVNVGKK